MSGRRVTTTLTRGLTLGIAVAVAISLADDLGTYGALICGAIVVLLVEVVLSALA